MNVQGSYLTQAEQLFSWTEGQIGESEMQLGPLKGHIGQAESILANQRGLRAKQRAQGPLKCPSGGSLGGKCS